MAEAFLRLTAKDRLDALGVAADLLGRPAHLLEKDVWVVWAIQQLFGSPVGTNLVFKGGTSLSKAYQVIDRFSEDVDLTFDIRALIPDLLEGREDAMPATSSEERRWSKRVRQALPEWVAGTIQPILQQAIDREGIDARLRIDGDKLFIDYPHLAQGTGYVSPSVMLEFGARSTGEPASARDIVCDAAVAVDGLEFPSARPRVMHAERTFWEKATAIHVFCLQSRMRGDRFSRHWHDVARLDDAGIAKMGLVLMSEREVHRIEVLSSVVARRMSIAEAASVLCLSDRQVQRLMKTFREDGAVALRHKARGRPSNNRTLDGLRDLTLALVREKSADFGPTLAAEKLTERDGVRVSRETVRKWMIEDGLWLSRKQRRVFHRPRLRRECYGELVQIDGSDHRWFEDRDAPCTLIVAVDDATGAIQEMRFVPSESTFAYFGMLAGYLRSHGKPVAFYSDKHSVFRVAKSDAKSGHQATQFGRALLELNIEILCANSSQAMGRVERKNRTLQDRLVKEMRLDGVTGIAAGNAWLPGYIQRHNEQFARPPARPDNLHRAVTESPDRLNDILCWRDQRYVGQQLTFSYERKRIMLDESELARGLVGQYVDTYAWPDGRFDVRWKGHSLPYSVFDPDQQRVTHAAITENKRLSEVLAYAKVLQDAAHIEPKVGKQKSRYQPTGKKSPGRKSALNKRAEARAAGSTSLAAE